MSTIQVQREVPVRHLRGLHKPPRQSAERNVSVNAVHGGLCWCEKPFEWQRELARQAGPHNHEAWALDAEGETCLEICHSPSSPHLRHALHLGHALRSHCCLKR